MQLCPFNKGSCRAQISSLHIYTHTHTPAYTGLLSLVIANTTTSRVSNPRPVRLCYAACGHICQIYIYIYGIILHDTVIFLFHGTTASSGPGSPHYTGFTITLRHAILGRTPLDEWSARRRDLYLTTHNTDKRQGIYASGRIRTRNPNKQAVADPRLRPCGITIIYYTITITTTII